MSTEWSLQFVMPNLDLEHAVETEFVALLPPRDGRLVEIASKSWAADALLNGFVDQGGRKVSPSALLVGMMPLSQ